MAHGVLGVGWGAFHVVCAEGAKYLCEGDPTFHVTMPNQKKLLNKTNDDINSTKMARRQMKIYVIS